MGGYYGVAERLIAFIDLGGIHVVFQADLEIADVGVTELTGPLGGVAGEDLDGEGLEVA